jgi:RimJ/RimL family protein N-acetyltransferase
MVYLETERLLLRDWQPSDAEPWVAMNADPLVRRYFPTVRTREESMVDFSRIQDAITERGYGWFAAEVRDTGAFIGFIGLSVPGFSASFTPCVEIGWRLAAFAWGFGFATEGARACLSAGFSRWGFPSIFSFTSIHNKPSERVMQRIGMSPAGTFMHPNVPEGHWLREHVLYRAIAGNILF